MASKYIRDGSQFYWVKTKIGAPPRKYRRFATRYRIGNQTETRKCNDDVRTLTAQEWQMPRSTATIRAERWGAWMEDFLALRYKRFAKSLTRYRTAWRTIELFLKENAIEVPRQLTRTHCFAYLTWRQKPNKAERKYKAGMNTALLELKFLGLVMKEAVHRGFAPANPCRELGIERDPARKPSELTDSDLLEIEAALEREPEGKRVFLLPSYQIARYHGVRELETHLDPLGFIKAERDLIRVVDLEAGSIAFHQKGGRVRVKPLHPRLGPLFRDLQARGARETFPMPKAFAREWHNFFRRHWKMADDEDAENTKPLLPSRPPKPCFHSLRVTVENKLRRAKVPKEIRMAYLSHETKDVNAGYDRFTLDELKACHAALG